MVLSEQVAPDWVEKQRKIEQLCSLPEESEEDERVSGKWVAETLGAVLEVSLSGNGAKQKPAGKGGPGTVVGRAMEVQMVDLDGFRGFVWLLRLQAVHHPL